MLITKEQFNEAYSNASPAQRYLCSQSGSKLQEIAKKYGIPKEAYKSFAITIGDVILRFFPKTELPNLLVSEVGLDEITALKMTGDLIDFLSPLTDPNWRPPKSPEDNEDSPDEVSTVTDEIAEAEAILKSLRTMSNDQITSSHENVIYPSQQADILIKNNPSSTPKSPRWETGN